MVIRIRDRLSLAHPRNMNILTELTKEHLMVPNVLSRNARNAQLPSTGNGL